VTSFLRSSCRVAGLLLALCWPSAQAAPDPAAEAAAGAESAELAAGIADDLADRIGAFHAVLLEVMQSGMDFDHRAATLTPKVAELFDLGSIARISLGRTWKSLDVQAQQTFTSLLEELITATYADRFDSFNGQSFHQIAVGPAGRGWVVRTELEKSNGERVALDYYIRNDKVYDVVADGVSDLSLRRADYNSVIKAEGYEALLAHIRENIDRYRTGDADDADY